METPAASPAKPSRDPTAELSIRIGLSQALERAKEAGAILDDDSLLMQVNSQGLGQGGLMGRSRQDVWALQQSLLPEGSRHYYDQRGLPQGAVQEDGPGYTKMTIPPASGRNQENLHPRLVIADIMNDEERKAFAGTTSLNPMQSTVFDVAFHRRENMLVCAPTGAG